jgi:hypothetical protein
MPTRNSTVVSLVAAAVVLTGACSDVPPTAPVSLGEVEVSLFAVPSDEDRRNFTGTLDHEFARIAQEIPGFGGFFYDESGRLTVVLAPMVSPMSPAEVRSRLAPRLEALGQSAAAAQTAVLREGRYDFAQIFAMRRRADEVVWSLRGVVFTDADEKENRVAIGVEDAAAAASVEQALAMAGIAREAVILRETTPLRFSNGASGAAPTSGHTLQDRVRPVAGALALRTSAPFFPFCSVAFNVRSPQVPNVHGFMTHAFCAAHPYGTGPLETLYWQPDQSVPESFIGMEAHNMPPFTGGACPDNPSPDWLGCRWTTAAGGRYAAGVVNAFGRLYRTSGIGSIEIDPVNPMFEIVAEIPMSVLGQEVHKIGAQTGWTLGPVIATCVNVGHTWLAPGQAGAITALCQDRAQTPGSGFLDWGGPVFVRDGEEQVQLLGLISFPFFDTAWYSPMGQIRLENPPPAGRAWRTF